MTQRDFFMIGDNVDCVIGTHFLPNQLGGPLTVREAGAVAGFDQYGKVDVQWPGGEVFGYEPALLRMRVVP